MEPVDLDANLEESEFELSPDPTTMINMGPAHPAMHGTVRCVLELSGENIVKADVQVGYLHRGFEKMSERGTWNQIFPYVDRANYISPMLNNVGLSLACEKMLGIEVPKRCQYYRVMLGELARISDHLTCAGAMAMELGAFTPFLWVLKAREMVWEIMEEETGARLTHSFGRVGGMAKPPTDSFKEHAAAAVVYVATVVDEIKRLLLGNRIFLDRLEGVGVISAEDAISLGWTGPCLRASGVPYDVRRAHPYSSYDEFDFEVPVGTKGDCFDRFMMRIQEIEQSTRIITQAAAVMPDSGSISVDDPRITLPEKEDVYNSIEGTIQHFKIVMEGIKIPAGEVYSYTEAGNGELGFYLVSDGSGTPHRVRIRPPCFLITSGLERIITGEMVADIVPCFGSLNMIGGECDR
jgi:NADH-quinone oxidoreductase subunit D